MITSYKNKGIQMTFQNGLTISIQFGYGNYCSNGTLPDKKIEQTAYTVEIAIWDKDDNWFKFDKDNAVKGWVDIDEVAIWIDEVRRAKNIKSIRKVK